MLEGWSTTRTYNIHYNEVGGVTNGYFKVEVRGVSGLKLLMTPSSHVLGMLVDALERVQTTKIEVRYIPSTFYTYPSQNTPPVI